MADIDLARIKRNVAKMAAQNAPFEDIDGYIASEGTTVEAVRSFKTQQAPKEERKPSTMVRSGVDAAILGGLDTATFGLLDEAGSGIDYLLDKLPGRQGRSYDELLAQNRGEQKAAQDEHGTAYLAGQVGGALIPGAGLARAGLSLSANAVRAGAGLGRTAMMSAADGAIAGAAQGTGSGEGLNDRVQGAITGVGLGGAGGAAAPYVVAGASAALKPIIAPIAARLRPGDHANQAMVEAMRRAGATPDEIVARLREAQADGQDMFNVADAMGNAGQRMLSTVARNPNEARQSVIEGLQARQMGQGERLVHSLADGFDAPDTAAQRTARLTAERRAAADANYGAARGGARPVDPSAAIRAADTFLRPGATGVLRPETNIADDSVEAAVRKARSYLTDGRSMVTDFDAAFRAKVEIDSLIEGAKPTVRKHLIPVRNALDDALSKSSSDYAAARDTFRRQSQTIDAVEGGTAAASGRTRAVDNIQRFGGMRPDEQSAFRAGYVDPIIAGIERASSSPTTNKARQIITGKTAQEFPVFAAPGKADQLGRRVGREQRMFETANAALGGSKTADNLADAAEMSKFDPSVMTALFQGRPIAAAVQAVTKLVAEAQGMPPSVLQQVAKTLMETRPDAVKQILADAMKTGSRNASKKALANTLLLNLNAAGAGRL